MVITRIMQTSIFFHI